MKHSLLVCYLCLWLGLNTALSQERCDCPLKDGEFKIYQNVSVFSDHSDPSYGVRIISKYDTVRSVQTGKVYKVMQFDSGFGVIVVFEAKSAIIYRELQTVFVKDGDEVDLLSFIGIASKNDDKQSELLVSLRIETDEIDPKEVLNCLNKKQ